MRCTSVCVDLRGFSKFYQELEHANENERADRLLAIRQFFEICEKVTYDLLNGKKCDILLTGDGAIIIFRCQDHHYIHGYMFSIILRKRLKEFFKSDNIRRKLSFGIGVASGELRQIEFGTKLLNTNYMSTAINRSARLEKLTKVFSGSDILISHTTMWQVFSTLSSENLLALKCKNYEALMDAAKQAEKQKNISLSKQYWDTMQQINETYFVRFVSNYSVEGSANSDVIYRFSRILSETIGGFIIPLINEYFSQESISVIKKELNVARH